MLCASAALAAALPSLAQASVGLAALQSDFTHQLAIAGHASGAYVYDLTAKEALFAERATTPRPPASVEKLYTATTALELMGPNGPSTTAVFGSGRITAGGVWEGNLYLRGGGDPTFGSTAFIPATTAVSERPSPRSPASSSRSTASIASPARSMAMSPTSTPCAESPRATMRPDPFLEGTLSALAFNRGQSGSENGPHAPAAYAARELWRALTNDGVKIGGPVRRREHPRRAPPAWHRSIAAALAACSG